MGKTKIAVLNNNSVSSDNSSQGIIQIQEYQTWFDDILRDDVDNVKSFLDSVSPSEKDRILHSRFQFEKVEDFEHLDAQYRKISLPFHLAVAYCSTKVADLFLQYSVDPLCQDEKNHNILHSCVISAFYNNDLEERLCNVIPWLKERLESDLIKKLLFQENSDGFRPLEFAAQQGTLRLMNAFLESDGHMVSSEVAGLNINQKFEITEYETGDRHSKSPVSMMAFLDSKKLQDPQLSKVLLGPLMTTWINGKMKSNLPFLIAWVVIRLLLLFLYYVIDSDVSYVESIFGTNTTRLCPELSRIRIGINNVLVLVGIAMLICVSICLVDIMTVARHFKSKRHLLMYNLNGKKKLMTSSLFYKIDQAILIILLLFLLCGYTAIVGQHMILAPTALIYTMSFSRVMGPVLFLWSLCYFIQLLPIIGSAIISLQKMIVDMVSFTIILAINTLLFAHVAENFVMSYSTVGCVDEFSNPLKTSYTILRMMFNMYDTTQLQVNLPGVFYVIHVLYVFTSAILLLNFLIAIMAESASKIAENEKTILRLNQLAVIVTLEYRLFWIFKRLYRVLHQRSFVSEDGRLFLCSFSDRRNSLMAERGCLQDQSIKK